MEAIESRRAGGRGKLWFPPRLQEKIILHLIRTTAGLPGPLILLAHGPPGEGKTSSIKGILRSYGVAVFAIEVGRLESPEAGEPAGFLRETYLQAATIVLGEERPAALVLDDIDLGLGQLGELTQYTVNRQHLLASFMALCDDPRRVFGRRVPRIPVFMTANAPTLLHGPLVRSGRAEMLPWELSLEERRLVVARMFARLGEQEIARLIDWFPTESVAFYADLNRLWADELALSAMARTRPRKALRMAIWGQWRVADDLPGLADLLRLGAKAQACRREGTYGEKCHDAN
jgi:hypothetical protein